MKNITDELRYYPDEKEKELYLRVVNEKFNDSFIRVLFDKDKIMLLKDYNSVMAEHVVQNVGKPVIFKRFAPRTLMCKKHPYGKSKSQITLLIFLESCCH